MFFADETRAADGGNENISAAGYVGQIARFGMTHSNRRVLLLEKHRHRLPDDIAPTHDDGILTGDRNIRSFEYLDHAGRRARHQRANTLHQPTGIDRMKTIDVLFRIDRLKHASLIDLLWQRKLHQNSIDVISQVERSDDLKQLLLSGRLRDRK